jgi:hypothetical protein
MFTATWFRCLFKMVRKVNVKEDQHEDGPEYVMSAKKTKDYVWFEMTVLSRWEAPDRCSILCIDAPFDMPARLDRALARRRTPLDFHDPFAMHAVLWDLIIVYYDISVWRVRDPVRVLEKVSYLQSPSAEPPLHHGYPSCILAR